MESYLLDWLNLFVRWLHLISGVAWIGASFYFVMLDLSLRKPAKKQDIDRAVSGELWAVHGGGVYQSQKFIDGPKGEPLSEHLHWSKWEAYTTWLSGMGLLVIIYWFGARTYLIDQQVLQLSVVQAIAISVGMILISWFIYDFFCRKSSNENLLLLFIFSYILVCDWVLFQLFSARAAYIHVGAIMGSLMAANVFFHIIPGQKKMVQEIRAGKTPNPEYGLIGKQRSVHNTYFTLPVLFVMISNHYPVTYSHDYGWLVLALIMMSGVLIRQFFVLKHIQQLKWWLPLVAVGILSAVIVWLKPQSVNLTTLQSSINFPEVQQIILKRCVSCHQQTPTQPGFLQPPKGIVLTSSENIKQYSPLIALTIANKYMPIGNLTGMTLPERQIIASWYAQGANVGKQ